MNKVASVVALLKAHQIDFIKLLINESIIDKENFMTALCEHCHYKGIRSANTVAKILDTIDESWGFADFDKIIFDHLISDLVNNFHKNECSVFTDYFDRLVNLGATVTDDYYNMLRIPHQSFF